jgi:hypothetical protein
MNDPRWRGWLVAAAIFILGVGVGGAGMAWVGIRVFRQVLQNPGNLRGLPERAANRIAADLTKNLKLTPEESAQVRTTLAQSAANLKVIHIQASTQVTNELRSTMQHIATALPLEKRADFYRIIARRYKRLGVGDLQSDHPDQKPAD